MSREREDRFREESDRIRKFFIRPFFLSVTIGIPFCTYKYLFGIGAIRAGGAGSPLDIFGWAVIAWAALDLFMNAGRAGLDLAGREAPFECCSLAQAGRLFRMPMVFLAIDTFLSFSIICFMLWSGWIALLTPSESSFWAGATTLNLLSLSIVSLYNEIAKLRPVRQR